MYCWQSWKYNNLRLIVLGSCDNYLYHALLQVTWFLRGGENKTAWTSVAYTSPAVYLLPHQLSGEKEWANAYWGACRIYGEWWFGWFCFHVYFNNFKFLFNTQHRAGVHPVTDAILTSHWLAHVPCHSRKSTGPTVDSRGGSWLCRWPRTIIP